MGIFNKKKKKDDLDKSDLSESDLDDSDIIDFDEFEDFEEELRKKESIDPKEVAKHFIFTVDNGCPICGSDVRGNDHFRYFCEKCNLLFDKKDIIEREFGQSIAETHPGPVRKTVLTDEERDALAERRKALSERIYNTFTKEQKEDLIEEAEEERAEDEAEDEDAELEEQEPEEVEEIIDEEPETEEDADEDSDEESKPEHIPVEHIVEAEYTEDTDEDNQDEAEYDSSEEDGQDEEVEDTDEDTEDTDKDTDDTDEDTEDDEEPAPEKVEYELEDEGKIIASSESDKLHKGNCHFVKKINPENRIYFDSIEQGEDENYELCVCLRRLKAMRRE